MLQIFIVDVKTHIVNTCLVFTQYTSFIKCDSYVIMLNKTQLNTLWQINRSKMVKFVTSNMYSSSSYSGLHINININKHPIGKWFLQFTTRSNVIVLAGTYTELAPDNTYPELTPEAEYENNSRK